MASAWDLLLKNQTTMPTPEELLMMNQMPGAMQSMNIQSMPSSAAQIQKPSPTLSRAMPGSQSIFARMVNPQNSAFRDALEEAQLNALNQERAGLSRLEDIKANVDLKAQRQDLAPVIGLTDWLSGGKSQALKAYDRPMSPEEADRLKFTLESELQKRKSGLASDVASALKAKQTEKLQNELLKQGRFEESQTAKLEKGLYQDIDKSFIKPALEKGQMFDQIEQQLRSGNYQDVAQIMSTLARNIGSEKGALSEGDVGRQVANTLQSQVAKLENYLTGKAKADPAQIEQILKTVNVARQSTIDAYSKSLDSKKNMYSKMQSYKPVFQPGGFGEAGFEEAKQAIQTFAPKSQTPIAPISGGLTPEQEARRQELLKKAGK